jgi:hypothetical protein
MKYKAIALCLVAVVFASCSTSSNPTSSSSIVSSDTVSWYNLLDQAAKNGVPFIVDSQQVHYYTTGAPIDTTGAAVTIWGRANEGGNYSAHSLEIDMRTSLAGTFIVGNPLDSTDQKKCVIFSASDAANTSAIDTRSTASISTIKPVKISFDIQFMNDSNAVPTYRWKGKISP